MAQQTQLRDSKGRFIKTKLSYKDLEQTIESLQNQLQEATNINGSQFLCLMKMAEFIKENTPFWKKRKMNKFFDECCKHFE